MCIIDVRSGNIIILSLPIVKVPGIIWHTIFVYSTTVVCNTSHKIGHKIALEVEFSPMSTEKDRSHACGRFRL